jgi:hypothetical protein
MSKSKRIIKITGSLISRMGDRLFCLKCGKALNKEKKVVRVRRDRFSKYYCISCAKLVNLI